MIHTNPLNQPTKEVKGRLGCPPILLNLPGIKVGCAISLIRGKRFRMEHRGVAKMHAMPATLGTCLVCVCVCLGLFLRVGPGTSINSWHLVTLQPTHMLPVSTLL